MTVLRTIAALIAGTTLVLMLGAGVPVTAQGAVSASDIQRLQDEVYQAGADLSRLRTSDALQAGRLQDELDTLREDVIYLKVKLRKENTVSRSEYTEVRDQLQDLRARARGEARASSPRGSTVSGAPQGGSAPVYDDRPGTTTRRSQTGIPAGQEIDVRIQTELTSDNAQVEDRFEATTVVDLYQGDRVIVPAGSMMRGLVTSVSRASRTDRKGSLTVAFNQITVGNRSYPMRGTVTEAIESSGIRGEAGRIGVLIGGGGTMVATEGKDVTVPAGTILRVRMDTPPEIG